MAKINIVAASGIMSCLRRFIAKNCVLLKIKSHLAPDNLQKDSWLCLGVTTHPLAGLRHCSATGGSQYNSVWHITIVVYEILFPRKIKSGERSGNDIR